MNLHHIVDTLDHIIIGIDEEWRYNYINAVAERALKRSAGELLGSIIWDCHPEAVGTEFERQCRRAMEERTAGHIAGGAIFDSLIVSILPVDGGISISTLPCEPMASAHGDDDGSAVGALDALATPVAVLDGGGRVVAVNRAWRELASMRHIVPIGTDYPRHCDALADADIAEAGRLADGIRKILAGDEEEISMELPVHTDRGSLWYRSRVTTLTDGGGRRAVVAHEDITDLQRKRLELEERERKLRQQLQITTTVAHKAAEGLFLMDREGRITFVNAAAEEMFGWSRQEMLGERLHDMVHYRHPDNTPYPIDACPLQEVFARGATVHNHEDVFYSKEGHPVFVACSNAPVVDAGVIGGAVLVVRDVSDHKRTADVLRDTEERYRMVARATNDVIWDWDLAQDEILWNEAIQTVFHYAPERMMTDGEWWRERIHPDDRDRVVSTIHQAIEGEGSTWAEEYRFRAHDGSYATIFDRGHIYRNRYGQAIRLIGSMLDLTERKRNEEALKRAKEEAEAASQAKDQFLAVLSHELRTPLTPALASIQVLEDAGMPGDLRPFIEIIRRNIELEARLIDDLLDLTRIARGKVELHQEVIDIHAIVRNVVETCHADIRQKHILLWQNFTAPRHHVWGDSARLHQVLWNVLKNAIKFTREGGTVTIRTETDDERVRVIVADTGIGIEENVLPMIFDAFMQGEQQINRRFGGLGLGLAISKSMVEMHGGTISATSDGRDKGATIVVELPIASSDLLPLPEGGDASPEPEMARATILLVDDHIDTLDVIKIILERRGLRVQTAASVRAALDLAGNQKFDLVVSDIGLPDGTGHDLIRALRARASGPVKAIAMSGFGMDEDLQHSIDAGFHDHLIKPVNIRKLEETITRLLGQ